MRLFIAFILLFSFTCILFSQNDADSQLALQYYKDKDYEKAVEIFEQLYSTSRSKVYFTYYINCLIELNRNEDAVKEVKKQIKRNPDDLSFCVELGYLYKLSGDLTQADEEYQKAIKKLIPHQTYIINLANAFVGKREFDYAETVYLQGRKMLKGEYSFNFELASIYRYKRDFQKMIDEYLDLLIINEGYIQSVQNSLQATIYGEDESELTMLLKTNLIKRIQKYPDIVIYSELLIWQYLQEKDFDNAFIHTKALDKRENGQGNRIISLGNMAVSNDSYDIAINCYKYVIDLGDNNLLYYEAKNRYLNAIYLKITSNLKFTLQEINDLEFNYEQTLAEIGKSDRSINLIVELAHIKAFYLDKLPESITLLEEAIKIPKANTKQLSLCKLELGDILLFSNDPWEATLYYAQVEQSNQENPVGHEAKFRKAKLAYYTGNFKWAQAQLDVLKASTSKLIANDAFELATLINDNTIMDTSETALMLFARADLLMYQKKDSLAMLTLDTIQAQFSDHSLMDDILYRKANVFKSKGDYIQAAEYFQKVVDYYSYDILADNSLYYLAELYELHLNDKEKAKELYNKLMLDFPGSIYVIEARKRFRLLRGDKIEKLENKTLYQ